MTALETGQSRTVDLGGPTHYLDFGGPADAPLLLAVHGLGGAAWNWLALAPLLRDQVRVLAIDLAGHGLSPAAGRSTTVGANRRLVDRFITEVAGEPVVLVGNSMGGLISVLEAAASPHSVRGAVLVDPALPRPPFSRIDSRVALQFAVMALPLVGEAAYTRRRSRQSAEQQIRQALRMCTVDLNRVPQDVIEAGVRTVNQRNSPDFPPSDVIVAGRSVVQRVSRAPSLQRAMTAVQAPVLVLHGEKDRLVPVAAARRAAKTFPHWRLEVADDVGHVPMLEAPDWTATRILDWLRSDTRLLG
ncbi:MAG TPA: alpha/beta hydrolase [Mycobacteriales bacterium]|nr:alpha/beta hydrolase [Mycobacteriales bacterium]HWC34205.1 alpha/beta hydrolase [Mycobacteriales bacterium]